MDQKTKNFHFIELDWLVCFPKSGNRGKYIDYNVILMDRKKETKKSIRIREFVENPQFENGYPYTVGFYKSFSEKTFGGKPEYLEIRKINDIYEFWLFLNALDI